MSESIRSFLTIELSDEAGQFLDDIQIKLKRTGGDVRWIKPKNIHLTLKFLKEIEREKIDDVVTAVAESLKDIKSFEAQLSELGVFPDMHRPRIIWAGLKDPAGEINHLVGKIELALQPLGFPKEDRDFQAHITLGRVRSLKNISQLIDAIKNLVLPAGPEATDRLGDPL
ncbi:MAG: RNA 2',3'-cyclic phosphodiesterase [Candidatus Omnitrophota bacterium]|nr:RNA 2',3'-cyclic phosphodiesterase [Candidatus Omnitrophota bacterium]